MIKPRPSDRERTDFLHRERSRRSTDPLFALLAGSGSSVSSSVSSVCFVRDARRAKFGGDGVTTTTTAATDSARVEGEEVDDDDLSESEGDEISISDDDDDDDDEDLGSLFRCGRMSSGTVGSTSSYDAESSAASLALSGTLLASCQTGGDAFLWDLGSRRIVSRFGRRAEGGDGLAPGMTIRRLGGSGMGLGRFLYQTRDAGGTVSVHDIERLGGDGSQTAGFGGTRSGPGDVPIVAEFATRSRTFCAAAPCEGDEHLVALPSERECYATIRDMRMDPATCNPVAVLHGAGLGRDDDRKHGMLMSLAMSATSRVSLATDDVGESWSRPVLACGMESGSVFFHDLAMVRRQSPLYAKGSTSCARETHYSPPPSETIPCEVKVGKDPVLSLDLSLSPLETGEETDILSKRSVVAVAGSAGDAAEMCEMPEAERGTVAIIKASFVRGIPSHGNTGAGAASASHPGDAAHIPGRIRARLRSRAITCNVGASAAGGKPGVAACRFRPDGRVWAVGGWDRRLRIYDRSSADLLAICRGHTDSVVAVDWTSDAASSGVLATGGSDGRIYVWRVYPNTGRRRRHNLKG